MGQGKELDAIATMAVGHPDDLDLEAWFEAAVRIDQSRTTNEAFQMAVRPIPSLSTLPFIAEELPTHPETTGVLDIKGMSADDIRKLIRELSGTKTLKTSVKPQPKVTTTQLPNRYSELMVDDTYETPADVFTLPEVTCTKPIRKPKWESNFRKIPRLVPRKLGLTLSTLGWKLKARKLSGSRESAL